MQLAALPLNGDGRRPSELAPEAYRLLEAFQWEWVRVYEHGDNESLGEWDAAGKRLYAFMLGQRREA